MLAKNIFNLSKNSQSLPFLLRWTNWIPCPITCCSLGRKMCAVRGMARLKPELYFPAELFFPPVAFSGNRKTVANCVVSSEIAHFFVDCIPPIQILMIQCQICNFTWSLWSEQIIRENDPTKYMQCLIFHLHLSQF